jgi:hypothetical protein
VNDTDFFADRGGYAAFIADVERGADHRDGFGYRVIKRLVPSAAWRCCCHCYRSSWP